MRQIIRDRGIVAYRSGLIAFLILIASPGISRALQRTDAPAAMAASLPVAAQWVYPVGDPAVSPTYGGGNANGYAVTQGFNTSCDPSAGQGHYYAGYYFCGHTGVDLSSDGAYGGMVRAVAAGQVVFAGPDGSYGNMVRIEHLLPDGHIVYSQYEHLGYNTVTVWYGEIVAAGQQIGAVGDSGFAQGAHLHFEIKDTNSDGPGYTFGNAALLGGYYEPLSFLQVRIPVPTPVPAVVATAVTLPLARSRPPHSAPAPSTDSEGGTVLRRFLHQYHYFVTVTIPALRLRAGPGPDARQVGVVKKHTRLALLGVTGTWLRVALPENVTGWVHGAYVNGSIPASLQPRHTQPVPSHHRARAIGGGTAHPLPSRPHATPRPPARPDIHHLGPLAQVLSDGIRVRSGPHLHDAVLFLAYRGGMVAVREARVSWVRATFSNGATGWILSDYLALPPAIARQTTAPRPHPLPSRPHATPRPPARPDIHHLGPLAQVLSDGIRVRSGPHLHDAVLFLAYRGGMVAVREARVSWVRATFSNGATGWILSHYLQLGQTPGAPHRPAASAQRRRAAAPRVAALLRPAPEKVPATAASAALAYTWATTLYVRSTPRLGGSVVVLAGENTPVRVLDTHVSWSHVRLADGQEGWVLSHYLKNHPKIYPAQPASASNGL